MRRRGWWCAAVVAVVASLSTTGCVGPTIGWRVGVTHGVIIETGAVRASIGVWRAPTKKLRWVARHFGVDTVQAVLCAGAEFPPVPVPVPGTHAEIGVLGVLWCRYVYDDRIDLLEALQSSAKSDDCLALTLVSRGVYTENWTHKRIGCREGALP